MKEPIFASPWGDAEFQSQFASSFQKDFYSRILKAMPLSPDYDPDYLRNLQKQRIKEASKTTFFHKYQ